MLALVVTRFIGSERTTAYEKTPSQQITATVPRCLYDGWQLFSQSRDRKGADSYDLTTPLWSWLHWHSVGDFP